MSCSYILTIAIVCGIHYAHSIALLETPSNYNGDVAESEIIQLLNNKDYLPNENNLPKSALKNEDDATLIISKMSDDELINLLQQEPMRKEYNLNDLVQVASKAETAKAFPSEDKVGSGRQNAQTAFFRLEDKVVEPFNYNKQGDPKYNAHQKLSNLLYNRQQQQNSEEDEMLFDALVAQLKSLCCKKIKPRVDEIPQLKLLIKNVMSKKKSKLPKNKISQAPNAEKPLEHIFLVINDEMKTLNDSEELIVVDPESLSKNSSVLLLGPIVTPLSEVQLKLVMTRIANEISKAEYLPLLQKISEGALENTNNGIKKSLITGPDSRRYIKPHRCNHQSKLAKVFGGPKWLICTGYLNINTPSLYD